MFLSHPPQDVINKTIQRNKTNMNWEEEKHSTDHFPSGAVPYLAVKSLEVA